jgi:hypothetical protein
MEQALAVAYDLIKRKAIKTVVLDTLSSFSELLADECLAAFQTVRADGTKNLPNGKLAWPDYLKRLKHLINRLERLPAHIIVTSHFQDFSSESDDKDEGGRRIPKVGDGIVPLLYGRARLVIGGMFPNVVYLDKERDSRVLLTNIHGVWGPGSRYIKGTPKIAPDIKELIKRMKLGPA